jgi:hypothetical protein
VITIGVRIDTDDLAARLRESIRTFGNRQFLDDLRELMERENEHHALRGLNRHGRSMSRWRTRRGTSDYHGRRYAAFTDSTTLVPYGRQSRRIAAFVADVKRKSFAGVGFGAVTATAGFTPAAGQVPSYWGRQDSTRDVLGLPPRTRRAIQQLSTRHASFAHRKLKRAGAAAGRAASRAASFVGL